MIKATFIPHSATRLIDEASRIKANIKALQERLRPIETKIKAQSRTVEVVDVDPTAVAGDEPGKAAKVIFNGLKFYVDANELFNIRKVEKARTFKNPMQLAKEMEEKEAEYQDKIQAARVKYAKARQNTAAQSKVVETV